ncbi:hypothetical protein [Xanthomonas medicagonis]|uniref:hypothetical protein n=1 Tax=Xanthomonas medicagonis TaxID=3160841 RepID=UPI0035152FB8
MRGLPLRSPATLAGVAQLANPSAHPPVASLEECVARIWSRSRDKKRHYDHQRDNRPSDNVIDRQAAVEYASDFRAPRVEDR